MHRRVEILGCQGRLQSRCSLPVPLLLVLPRTYDAATQTYGNLYSNLLDYVISAALIFYILTIAGVFRLRFTKPNVERPYRAFGYPVTTVIVLLGCVILWVAAVQDDHRSAKFAAVLLLACAPVYAWLARRRRPAKE